MEKINKKTFAALIKALIILSKYEPEAQNQKQYTTLIGKLCREYNRNPKMKEITTADEYEEFRKIKDETIRQKIILTLVFAAINENVQIAEAPKYHYLAQLLRTLDR